MQAWVGPLRENGTRGYVAVMLAPAPPNAPLQDAKALDTVLERLLGAIKARRDNWTQSEFERGTVNGLPFVRTRWKGTEKQTGREMEGIMYAALDGGKVIQLASQDVVPVDDGALDLAEASLLTFQPGAR